MIFIGCRFMILRWAHSTSPLHIFQSGKKYTKTLIQEVPYEERFEFTVSFEILEIGPASVLQLTHAVFVRVGQQRGTEPAV
jgi:hypothetical protein